MDDRGPSRSSITQPFTLPGNQPGNHFITDANARPLQFQAVPPAALHVLLAAWAAGARQMSKAAKFPGHKVRGDLMRFILMIASIIFRDSSTVADVGNGEHHKLDSIFITDRCLRPYHIKGSYVSSGRRDSLIILPLMPEIRPGLPPGQVVIAGPKFRMFYQTGLAPIMWTSSFVRGAPWRIPPASSARWA